MPHSIDESDSDSQIPLAGLRWNDTRDPESLYKVYSQLWEINLLWHDYDRQTIEAWLYTIMTSKLLRHDYGHGYAKETLVAQLQHANYGGMITTNRLW